MSSGVSPVIGRLSRLIVLFRGDFSLRHSWDRHRNIHDPTLLSRLAEMMSRNPCQDWRPAPSNITFCPNSPKRSWPRMSCVSFVAKVWTIGRFGAVIWGEASGALARLPRLIRSLFGFDLDRDCDGEFLRSRSRLRWRVRPLAPRSRFWGVRRPNYAPAISRHGWYLLLSSHAPL